MRSRVFLTAEGKAKGGKEQGTMSPQIYKPQASCWRREWCVAYECRIRVPNIRKRP